MHGAQPKTTTSTKSISRDTIVLLSREECAQYLFLYFFLSHSVFSVKLCIWALHLSSRSTVILAVAFRSSSAVSSIWWSPFASCPLSPQASGPSSICRMSLRETPFGNPSLAAIQPMITPVSFPKQETMSTCRLNVCFFCHYLQLLNWPKKLLQLSVTHVSFS